MSGKPVLFDHGCRAATGFNPMFDFAAIRTYHCAAMPVHLPVTMDAWRMVSARRLFEGSLPVAGLPRLVEAVARAEGEVFYTLQFGRDALGTGYIDVHAEADLILTCQRTLDEFSHPVCVDTRLGLIENENEEAGLPPGCEPLLLDSEPLRPAAVIEDELLLALPLIPVKPGSTVPIFGDNESTASAAVSEPTENPFAVLGKLKNH